MISDFLSLFVWFKHLYIFEKDQNAFLNTTDFIGTNPVEICEYEKMNNGYWEILKFLKQIVEKSMSIAKFFSSSHSPLMMFNDAISHAAYAKNALNTK